MRGMFTCGVLDCFFDHHMKFDMFVGVSAGALFGVNYLSDQRSRPLRYSKRFNSNKDYMGIRPLLMEGALVSPQIAYHDMPYVYDVFDDETYMKSGTPFYAVVTNLDTGEPEYIKVDSVFEQMDVLRASGSMPFVSKPVDWEGKRYLDGGVAEAIPFEWAAAQGYDKIIVVLTRDINYRKKPMNKALINLFYHKYPEFKQRLIERHDVYNREVELLKDWEKDGRAFVIRPSEPIEIGRMEKDPEKLQSVYDLGMKDATARFEALTEFISKRN